MSEEVSFPLFFTVLGFEAIAAFLARGQLSSELLSVCDDELFLGLTTLTVLFAGFSSKTDAFSGAGSSLSELL